MNDNNSNSTVFSNTEIIEICDSIKDIHRILKTVGEFFEEIDEMKESETNGNGFLTDFKKWGVKTLTKEMLKKQHEKIKRIEEIYNEEEKKL